MKIRNMFYTGVVMLSFYVTTPSSFAAGIGFSVGAAQEKWVDVSQGGERNLTFQGFIFDTSNERNIFNYRVNAMLIKNQSAKPNGLDMDGFSVANNFTFAIIQEPELKLWMGPQVKASSYSMVSSNSQSTSGDVIGISVGPVIGINFNLQRILSFSISASYDIISSYSSSYLSSPDVDAESTGFHLDAAMIFRLGRSANKRQSNPNG